MKNFCIVKILGTDERYLGERMADAARRDAPIENYDAACRRAERRFGSDWRSHAQIVEVEYSEVQAQRGRLGGNKYSPKRIQAIRARYDSMPLRIFTGQPRGNKPRWIVVARSACEAHRMLRQVGIAVSYATVYRSKRLRNIPFSKNPLVKHVWQKDKPGKSIQRSSWTKLL